MDKKTLFSKYNIVSRTGLDRTYLISLDERPFDLEGSTPVDVVLADNKVIHGRAWINVLTDLVIYLQNQYPKKKELLYRFKTDWSIADIFYPRRKNVNTRLISEDLYLNVNHTSVHTFWLIGDLLIIYGINVKKSYIRIHRPPLTEPQEVKKYVMDKTVNGFINYLIENHNYTYETANKVVHFINALEKPLDRISKSYVSFFYIDSCQLFSNLKSKLINYSHLYTKWDNTQLLIAKKCLTLLGEYYNKIEYGNLEL
ncbi:MAG: hypothetical protein K5906_04815 [Bacilli bacterium]|nr:hypothetical protein [Bacilli bacterium]